MPKYARGKETWDISLSGASFCVRASGKSTTRKFVTLEQARTQYDRTIATQLAAGFVEVDEDALLEPRLQDLDAYLVHGDVLLTAGNPRGELIAVQVALERTADEHEKTRLDAQAHALLAERHRALYGALSAHARSFTFHAAGERDETRGLVATWRHGAMYRVRIAATPRITLPEVYAQLRGLDGAQNLTKLVVGAPGLPHDMRRGIDSSYGALLAAVATHGVFTRVQSLVLGDVPNAEVNELELGSLDAWLHAIPRLRRLVLRGGTAAVGPFRLPGLQTLQLTGQCLEQGIEALKDATLPRLERLVVGTIRPRNELAEADSLQDLLRLERDRRGFAGNAGQAVLDANLPALRHLELHGALTDGTPFTATSLSSPDFGLSRLEALVLSGGALDDEGAALLARFPHALGQLKTLDLRENSLSVAAVNQLRVAFPYADLRDQRAEPSYEPSLAL